tara:strand:+ start:510 stop:890 length:381 start_codon:yes stop_codon:yes gene_type:complete
MAPILKESQFTLALKFKRGHRYFWFKSADYNGGFAGDKLAIADDSGDFPHMTDDGLLFIDSHAFISLHSTPNWVYASVPLIDPEGNRSDTPTSNYEAISVAKLLGLPIKIADPYGDEEPIEFRLKF